MEYEKAYAFVMNKLEDGIPDYLTYHNADHTKKVFNAWVSTVNVASRMESNGIPGKINISEDVFEKIKHQFYCSYRGKIHAKNVGEISMYLIEGSLQAS